MSFNSRTRAGTMMMLGTTFLWGIGGAVSTTFQSQPVALIAIALLVQAPLLLAAVYIFGLSRKRLSWRQLLLLAVIDAGQVVSYTTALIWAPPGPVAALHLTAPLILLGLQLVRRERTAGKRELAVAVLLVAGIAVSAFAVGGPGSGPHPLAGLILAALSAFFYAALVLVLTRTPEGTGLVLSAGLKALLMGLLCAPALLIFPVRAEDVLTAISLMAVFIPGGLLFWAATTRLAPTVTASLGLLEAIFVAVIAAVLFGRSLQAEHVLAIGLILAAVYLELSRRGNRVLLVEAPPPFEKPLPRSLA